MPEQTPRAFFSYSRHDSEFALKLAKDLRGAGAAVWLDQLDINPGEHWDSAVEKALENFPTMLLILSPSSVESTNVMDEVSFALEKNKVVIPVLYRDCTIPFRLRRLQHIDIRVDYEKGLDELLRTLRVVHPQAEAGTLQVTVTNYDKFEKITAVLDQVTELMLQGNQCLFPSVAPGVHIVALRSTTKDGKESTESVVFTAIDGAHATVTVTLRLPAP